MMSGKDFLSGELDGMLHRGTELPDGDRLLFGGTIVLALLHGQAFRLNDLAEPVQRAVFLLLSSFGIDPARLDLAQAFEKINRELENRPSVRDLVRNTLQAFKQTIAQARPATTQKDLAARVVGTLAAAGAPRSNMGLAPPSAGLKPVGSRKEPRK